MADPTRGDLWQRPLAERRRHVLPEGQRMARVNMRTERWEAFRAAASAANRSIGDYLGHLAEKELRRVERRQWRERAVARIESRVLVTVEADTQDEVM